MKFNFNDYELQHFHTHFSTQYYCKTLDDSNFYSNQNADFKVAFEVFQNNFDDLTTSQFNLLKTKTLYIINSEENKELLNEAVTLDVLLGRHALENAGHEPFSAAEIYRDSIINDECYSEIDIKYLKNLEDAFAYVDEVMNNDSDFMKVAKKVKNVADKALTVTFEYPAKFKNKIYFDKSFKQEANKYNRFDTFLNYIVPLLILISTGIWFFSVINGFPSSFFFYTTLFLIFISFVRYKTINFNNHKYLSGVWKHLSSLKLSAYEVKRYTAIFESHLIEFRKKMNVDFDLQKGYEISVDKDFGVIVSMFINKDKPISITSLNDELLTFYKIVPFLNPLNDSRAMLVHNRKISFMLYEILLKEDNADNEIQYLYQEKPEFFNSFKELSSMKKDLEEQKKLEEIEYKNKLELSKIQALNLSEKATNILSLVRKNKGNWGFNYWNLTSDAIVENDNFLRFRCKFLDNTTFNNIKNSKERIESAFRLPIQLKKLSDRGSFEMYILKESEIKPFSLKMSDVDSQNAMNKLVLGKTLTGDLVYNWNHQANHFIISGVSGSGKSVAVRAILAQLVQLTDFDYRELYLTSSSKVADFVDFEKKGAFLSSGVEKQAKVFDYILNKLEKREQLFYEKGVDSIKSYNEKYPENPMGQLILVADEWENSRNNLDSKLAKKLEGTLVAILNIARSSGAVVMVGSQSILKSDIGTIADKMTIRISGTNKKNVLNQIDTEIADYYSTLSKKSQGVFFVEATNLESENAQLAHGSTTFTLTQTPFISDISANLPVLSGAENSSTILNAGEDENIDEISIVEEFKEDFEIQNSTIDI